MNNTIQWGSVLSQKMPNFWWKTAETYFYTCQWLIIIINNCVIYTKNKTSFYSRITLLETIKFEFYYIYIDLIIITFQAFDFSLIRELFIVYEITKIN